MEDLSETGNPQPGLRAEIPAIGIAQSRYDAFAKVQGTEKYACDEYPPDLLWAGVKRAGQPHGILRRVNIEAAKTLPGVVAVLTAQDVPGTNRQGITHKDQPVIAGDAADGYKVRYPGDAVALVIAEDQDILRKALQLIELEIEPLSAVFDVEEALLPDAPLVHANTENNLLSHPSILKANGLAAFEECDLIVENIFHVPFQEHAFLETENGIAVQSPDGKISLTVSTQSPFRDRLEIAYALGLKPDQIQVISPYLGGGFGGKDGATVQCFLALACMHTHGRPVKMGWDRQESIIAGYKRHAATMKYRLGAKSDGSLHALHCELYFDTGAYAHLGAEVLELALEHAGGPYRIPHALVEGWAVYTNHPIGGAMRGFGVVQVSFAIERMLDKLAASLGMDRLEIRLKNALQRGDENLSGVHLTKSVNLRATLQTLQNHPLWSAREQWKKAAPRYKRRGVGVAAVHNAMGYGKGLADAAIAKVELMPNGHLRVYNGVSDMGQGNAATFVQIAGEILCQDVDHLELVQPDTEKSLPSGSSSAGRTTFTYGNALIKACRALKARLLHYAALVLLVDAPDTLDLLPGRVVHPQTAKIVTLADLAKIMPVAERVSTDHYTMPVHPIVPSTGRGFGIGFPHIFFSFASQLVYIEVDELTGQIQVQQIVAVTDGGRVLNPQIFAQQVQGAIVQSVGYGLMEEILLQNGQIINPDFSTYLIPTTLDVPDIQILSVAGNEEDGPFGMKGIGEVNINATLPAIANALQDALGGSPSHSPLTAERVSAFLPQYHNREVKNP